MNKLYFSRNFFLADWRHKLLKNKIDLLLIYREHFYGFSESAIIPWGTREVSKIYMASQYLTKIYFPSPSSVERGR